MKKYGIERVISFILSLVMVLSLCLVAGSGKVKAAAGGTITVEVSGVQDLAKMKRGDTVTISVFISDNTEAVATNFTFSYDSEQLEFKSATKGGAYDNAYVADLQTRTAGIIKSAIAYESEEDTVPPVNGEVFTAVFTVKDTAKGAISTQIKDTDFVSLDYRNVDCEVVNLASSRNVVVPATWTSSDETIATVNPDNGTVTALREGKVTITAKTTNIMTLIHYTYKNIVTRQFGQPTHLPVICSVLRILMEEL